MTEKEKFDLAKNLSQIRKWLSGEEAKYDCPKFISALSIAENIVAGIPTDDPQPMIPQIKDFMKDFEKCHIEPPLYVICNRRTFRDLEIEAGVGYVIGGMATVYGMIFKVPEDGEIIITNGRVGKYSFKGAGE